MTSCGKPNGSAGPDETAAPSSVATSNASQPAPAAAKVSFADFLAGVRSARYSDYAGKPATKVRSVSEFEAMRQYLLDRYGTAKVSRSYVLRDATFDCIAQGSRVPSSAGCPSGSVPVRRVTLAALVQFPTLQSFLSKGPGGGSLPPVPSPT
jgi:hypothetical protein